MAKTSDDEEYERQVKEGQRSDLLDGIVHGMVKNGSPGSKGFEYGVTHKYGPDGQPYHTWDNRGSNDPKDSREEAEKEEVETETSSDSSSCYGDNDRSYTYELSTEQTERDKAIGGFFLFFILVPVAAIIIYAFCSIIDQNIRQHKAAQQVIKENSLVKIDRVRDPRVPARMNDYSLSSDKSKIVFSQQVMTVAHITSWSSINTKRSRIFLCDIEGDNQRLVWLNNKAFYDISSDDFAAPLFSPNGRRIAFATTRDDHPSAVYIMDEDGANLKRISGWDSTIAFGWISNNVLFIWGSGYCSANIFDPFVYASGRSYCADVVKHIAPDPRFNSTRGRYVPTDAVKVKYVSRSRVNDYIIKREEK